MTPTWKYYVKDVVSGRLVAGPYTSPVDARKELSARFDENTHVVTRVGHEPQRMGE